MANEVAIVTLLGNKGDPVEWDVADGTALPFGTVMKVSSDPQVAAPATADGDLICGIVGLAKKADDGITKMALITHAVIEVTCTASTGSAVLGEPVKITGANTVAPADDATIEHRAEAFATSYETLAAAARGAMLMNIQ
ncbi:hypothetical protein KAR91_20490 [Candidatus Pacearchaeota archaeon]|nr:hypothetical protein [Candidatus Pacearchaeota archaeon]